MRTELQFAIDDKLLGEDVSPTNISLPMLEEFIQQVTAFVKGSGKINLKNIHTEIRQGSFAIAVVDEIGELEEAKRDYLAAANNTDLSSIDPSRREVLIQWQRNALKNVDRKYKLLSIADDKKVSDVSLVIDSESKFHFHQVVWADVEQYIYGRVYDLGGKTKSNVHLLLEDGSTLKAEADASLLVGDKVNRIYRNQLVRVKARQNIDTKEVSDYQLVSYEKYSDEFNKEAFDEFVDNGTRAWSQVDNPVAWLENLRGHYA